MLLAYFVSSFNNSILKKKEFVDVKFSKLIINCLIILLKEGFILGFNLKNARTIRIFLKYYKGISAVKKLKLISTPGFRKYINIKTINKLKNLDFFLISSPKGIISSFDIILNKQNTALLKTSKINLINNNNNDNIAFELKNINKNINLFKFFHNVIKINNLVFHKYIFLKAFFRKESLTSNLSWYFKSKKNFNLKFFYYYYFIKNNNNFHLSKKKLKKIKLLTFFNFKNYFSYNNFLKFDNIKIFNNFFLELKKNKNNNLFYFFFNLNLVKLLKYKYSFSLYIKYLNHLLKFKNHNNNILLNRNFNLDKKNGGELLLLVK